MYGESSMSRPVEVPASRVCGGKHLEYRVSALDLTHTSVSDKAASLFKHVVYVLRTSRCTVHIVAMRR